MKRTAISLLAGLLLSACSAAPTPRALPTQTPSPTAVATATLPPPTATHTVASATATPPPVVASSDDPVLAACDPAAQAAAMRPDHLSEMAALALPICYDLTLTIAPDGRTVIGQARLTFVNREREALDSLFFRLYPNADDIFGGEMGVSAARVDGTPVTGEMTLPDQSGYRLPLPIPLAPGGSSTIEIDYTLTVPRDLSGDGSLYGILNQDSSAGTTMFTAPYPLLAPYEPGEGWLQTAVQREGDAITSESAFFLVTIERPGGQVVASSGVTVGEQEGAAGQQTRIATGPMRDFAFVLLPSTIGSRTEMVDGTRIVSYFQPEAAARGREAAELTASALRYFNDNFGAYPYAELDVVQLPLNNALGVEFPGLFVVEATTYTEPRQETNFKIATIHETAHQWWYAVVGNDVARDPWLDEALTSWASLGYLLEREPALGRTVRQFWEEAVAEARSEARDEPIAQPLDAFAGREEAYGLFVYVKGPLFFQALREEIGDDAFFAALQRYYADHRYGMAAPADLLTTFEEAAGRDLSPIYQQWGVE